MVESAGWRRRLVAAFGSTHIQPRLETFYTGFRGGWFWRGFGDGMAVTNVENVPVGTLVVDAPIVLGRAGLNDTIVKMRSLGLMALGFILGLAIIAAALYFYISYGYAPVSTAAAPLPFEKTITGMALNARIKKEAPAQAALPLTDDNLIAGAHEYSQHCAVCHGLIGQPETAISKGMFPKPPQLFRGHGVTDDPVGETYWKIENGIRLTGMPAFRQSLSENQIWQMALLLANADKLPPAAKTILSSPAP